MLRQKVDEADEQDFNKNDDELVEPFNREHGIFKQLPWKEMKIDDKMYIAKVFLARREATHAYGHDVFPNRYGWELRSFKKLVAEVQLELNMKIVLPFPFDSIGVDEDGRIRYRKLRTGTKEYFVGILDGEDQYGSVFPKAFLNAIMEVYYKHKDAFSMQQKTFEERYGIPKETWTGWCERWRKQICGAETNAMEVEAIKTNLKRKSSAAGSEALFLKRQSKSPLSPTSVSTPVAQCSSSSSSSSASPFPPPTRNKRLDNLITKIDVLQQIVDPGTDKKEELVSSLRKLLEEAVMKEGEDKIQILECLETFFDRIRRRLGEAIPDYLLDIHLDVLNIREEIEDNLLLDQESGRQLYLHTWLTSFR